jgi:hypothetical protein
VTGSDVEVGATAVDPKCGLCGQSVSFASRYRRGGGSEPTLFCSSHCRKCYSKVVEADAQSPDDTLAGRGSRRLWPSTALLGLTCLACLAGVALALASGHLTVLTAAFH